MPKVLVQTKDGTRLVGVDITNIDYAEDITFCMCPYESIVDGQGHCNLFHRKLYVRYDFGVCVTSTSCIKRRVAAVMPFGCKGIRPSEYDYFRKH